MLPRQAVTAQRICVAGSQHDLALQKIDREGSFASQTKALASWPAINGTQVALIF
jgi:hypothetical protein